MNIGMSLFLKLYEEASDDKVSVKEFLSQSELRNMLFNIDFSFYSTENVYLFISYGNAYIIPVAKKLKTGRSLFIV